MKLKDLQEINQHISSLDTTNEKVKDAVVEVQKRINSQIEGSEQFSKVEKRLKEVSERLEFIQLTKEKAELEKYIQEFDIEIEPVKVPKEIKVPKELKEILTH